MKTVFEIGKFLFFPFHLFNELQLTLLNLSLLFHFSLFFGFSYLLFGFDRLFFFDFFQLKSNVLPFDFDFFLFLFESFFLLSLEKDVAHGIFFESTIEIGVKVLIWFWFGLSIDGLKGENVSRG